MKREDRRNAKLDAAYQRARRKIAEVQMMLDPTLDGTLELHELQEHLATKLQSLPPADREHFKLKIAVAVADLGAVIGNLSGQLKVIKDDLGKLNGQRVATAAYGRWNGGARSPRGRHG